MASYYYCTCFDYSKLLVKYCALYTHILVNRSQNYVLVESLTQYFICVLVLTGENKPRMTFVLYSTHYIVRDLGADGRSRTGTAFATAPSRQRVYQFHHIGMLTQYSSLRYSY